MQRSELQLHQASMQVESLRKEQERNEQEIERRNDELKEFQRAKERLIEEIQSLKSQENQTQYGFKHGLKSQEMSYLEQEWN